MPALHAAELESCDEKTMSDGKYIVYYRVSIQKQRIPGLGLEAQQEAVAYYLSGGA